jgi:hypothetical protein
MRVCFLIDGFNLYHSVRAAERDLGTGPLRWLDLPALCSTLVSSAIGPGAKLSGIHYFSALAKHLEARKPDVVRRHRTYIAALEANGVEVYLANFKKKDRSETLDRISTTPVPIAADTSKWQADHQAKCLVSRTSSLLIPLSPINAH